MRQFRRGFTLLELMIAITLMLVVMLMLRSMFVNAQEIYIRSARRVDVYAQARAVLDAIDNDLMRLKSGVDNETLTMRSLTPQNWTNPEQARTSENYSSLNDWDGTPNSDETGKIREFLSFRGVFTWWDRTKQEHVTGHASVIYYLRRRYQPAGTDEGAYLVRRLVPYLTTRELVAYGKTQDQFPTLQVQENELASFVYSVRVFVDDQSAFRYNVLQRNNNLSIMPEASQSSPNQKWLWRRQTQVGPPPTPGLPNSQQLILPLPPDGNRVEFGGIWTGLTGSSNPNLPNNPRLEQSFTSGRWNYPSVVMIEITMVDRYFQRFDTVSGDGTYRTFTRAVQLPVSRPMTQLDAVDIRVIRGG